MQSEFLKFIDHHNLFAKSDKVLLAVSGGVDSVVLAHLFHETKRRFGIAHCNFQLRGKESDSEEEFVKELATSMEVAFHCERFETMKVVLSEGISTQMAARNLRYEWFNKLRFEEGYQYVATAHHLNDSIETIIFNLTKGTGIAGLHGILAKNNHIVRPLLFAERESILSYARKHDLKWKEDSSNLSDKYHRNLIRNKIIPTLKEINPGMESTVEQTIDKIRSTEEVLHDAISKFESKRLKIEGNDIWIDSSEILEEAGSKILLYETIKKYGFNYSQTKEILEASVSKSGSLFYSNHYVLNVDREYLIISPLDNPEEEIKFSIHQKEVNNSLFQLHLQTIAIEKFKMTHSADDAHLDQDKLNSELTLRLWKAGDRFYPLGMSKQKKLSDFMIDEKIPVNLKARTYVLTSGKDIIWVVGHRIDNRFKVTSETKTVLKISKILPS